MKIDREIKRYSDNLDKKVVNIINECLDYGLEELKEITPIKTGFYKSNMMKENATKKGNVISGRIYNNEIVTTTGGKEYLLAELLENGTDPHIILPVNYPYLHFQIGGKNIYAKKVNHPGFMPIPHWQPTFEKVSIKFDNLLKEKL